MIYSFLYTKFGFYANSITVSSEKNILFEFLSKIFEAYIIGSKPILRVSSTVNL